MKTPKNYKCFIQELDISEMLKNNFIVITGLNGSGKTILLKHIYNTYKQQNDKYIYFKTTNINDNTNDKFFRGRRWDSEEISVDSIFEDIYAAFLQNMMIKKGRTDVSKMDLFEMLYNEESYLYDVGYDFLIEIINMVAKHIPSVDQEALKEKLGIPTDKSIEDKITDKIKENIKKNDTEIKSVNIKKINDYKQTEPEQVAKITASVSLELKKTCRNKAKINSKEKLEELIFDLLNPISSIESIVRKISKKIEDNFSKTLGKTKTNQYWEEINKELDEYKDFKYKLNKPSLHTKYEMTFSPKKGDKIVYIEHAHLSSGEKMIFELILYYFTLKDHNQKNKIIILDEFDANLNPALSKLYLDVIKKQFVEKNIKIILTTHSPSTVVEVDAISLYELRIENDKHKILHANDIDGKKNILEKLAPKFVWYDELGILGLAKCEQKTIIFTEGKKDERYLSQYATNSNIDKYRFIECDGASNVEFAYKAFTLIPYLKNILKHKTLIFLWDFDEEGLDHFMKAKDSKNTKSACITCYTDTKKLTIYHKKEINHNNEKILVHFLLLTPNTEHSWKISNAFEDQHLNGNDDNCKIQFDIFDKIENDQLQGVDTAYPKT